MTPEEAWRLARQAGSTLVVTDRGRPERFVACRSRPWDRVLARVFACSLDRRLAAGRAPESSRLLASRAQQLVSSATRRELARDWEHLLEVTRRPPARRTPRVPLCRDRISAAEADVRDMLTSLLTPLPMCARGVATASRLLSDAAGPLCSRHCTDDDLRAALREATAQLDPELPLMAPASAEP
jgi:hypothetical protein